MTNCLLIKNQPLKSALASLKEAHKSQDVEAIDKALAELNAVWQTASEEMYKTAQNAGPEATQPGEDQQTGSDDKPGNDEVTDVDFEEVK